MVHAEKSRRRVEAPGALPVRGVRSLNGAAGLLQRKCDCGTHTDGGGNCARCNQKQHTLRRHSAQPVERTSMTGEVPLSVQDVLRSPGQPLDANTRAFMEPRFKHDFSDVRVHTDARAAESARAVNALAYTTGRDVVFDAGQYMPDTIAGRQLLAYELTHVLQQQSGAHDDGLTRVSLPTDAPEQEAERMAEQVTHAEMPARGSHLRLSGALRQLAASPVHSAGLVQRTIKIKRENRWWEFGDNWRDMYLVEQDAFIKTRFAKGSEQQVARAILEDIVHSADDFMFDDYDELFTEISKRIRTVQLMRETQERSPLGKSFGYPDAKCSARVNKAAQKYWGAVKGNYYFELSDEGKQNAYAALTTLFTPQKNKCDRTLIHCDYLTSVVHMRVFAESIGVNEFNDRVKHGVIPLTLKWNGFKDIVMATMRSAKQESLRDVYPSSEKDLVIGDHVIFWNHRAYDLLNKEIREAWRLENAVLEEKRKDGEDIFEGHGSGRHTNQSMRGELMKRYNKVVKMALDLIKQTRSKDKKTSQAARKEMADKFPSIKEVGTEWRIQGLAHSKVFNDPVKLMVDVNDKNLTGLRDPDDPTKMNKVRRPKESA